MLDSAQKIYDVVCIPPTRREGMVDIAKITLCAKLCRSSRVPGKTPCGKTLKPSCKKKGPLPRGKWRQQKGAPQNAHGRWKPRRFRPLPLPVGMCLGGPPSSLRKRCRQMEVVFPRARGRQRWGSLGNVRCKRGLYTRAGVEGVWSGFAG